jgi:CBS domain-containing protein
MKIQLKELLIRPISEISAPKKVVTCSPETPIEEAIKLLRGAQVGSIVVVDGLKIHGIFTERDYLEKIGFADVDEKAKPVSAFMTKNPICSKVHEPIGQALLKMRQGHFRHLILVDSYGNLQSIISMREVTEYLFSTVADALYGQDEQEDDDDEKKTGTDG